MVGILSLIVLKSTKVANYVKEKVAVTLFIKDNITQKQIKTFRESLLEEEFTKKAIYTSKAQAAKRFSEQIGEDFLEFLGENPLKNGIDIYLKADFVTPEKVAELEQRFQKNVFVADISYDKPLINLLTKNIKRISFWLLVLSSFFALVAMILINSSIRLSIYSKRFNIKTMQMVGATKGFIRRPFIFRSLKLGLFGALIALMGIAVIIYYLDKYIPALNFLEDYITLAYISGIVIILSLTITWISTFFATQRFLNLQTDELYY